MLQPPGLNRVVFCSPYIPPEWIRAHGLEPLRLDVPHSGLTGGAIAETAGVCPFMRAFANEAARLPGVAGIVAASTCDQMRRIGDAVAPDAFPPLVVLHIPNVVDSSAAFGLYVDELRRLGRFMIGLGGHPPADDAFRTIMLEADAQRASLLASGREPKAPSHAGPRRPSLALVTGHLLGQTGWIREMIESLGGDITLDASEYGDRCRPLRLDRRRLSTEDPLTELAHIYYGAMRDIFRRPNREFYVWLTGQMRRTPVDGVVAIRHTWCDKWHAEIKRIRGLIEVPVLELECAGGVCETSIRNRLEAFMEAL
jgi:benzoyl-CoA reductase/2-hydroxyglutaryl-CoA dehydratase subunit BcrC/BadD/HgdB